jgi:KDO2-lipid IV(A) lauroyltransferase
MAPPRSAFTAWGQYLAMRLAEGLVTAMTVEHSLDVAASLGRVAVRLDRRRRERCLNQLRIAFPQASAAELDSLCEAAFVHLVQLVMEVVHTPRQLHPVSWSRHVKIAGLGPAIDLLSAGRPAILVTGHLGNWEVLGYLLALLGFRLDAVARPIDNPLINEYLLGIRERRGMRIITKFNASDRMVEVLQQGGALGFIADQNAGDKGLFVPFFGKLASTYKSIGLLAINQNVPIICGYAQRVGTGYGYELGVQDIIRPEDWAPRRDPLFYVTARYMHAIEMMVRQAPRQYLWFHRRWKSRPRHEREGKPLPAALQRNLEDLPWMDQATLTRLAQPINPPAPSAVPPPVG